MRIGRKLQDHPIVTMITGAAAAASMALMGISDHSPKALDPMSEGFDLTEAIGDIEDAIRYAKRHRLPHAKLDQALDLYISWFDEQFPQGI